MIRGMYRMLPLTDYDKRRIKSAAYRALRPCIAETESYRHWRESQPSRRVVIGGGGGSPIVPPAMIQPPSSGLLEAAARLSLPCSADPQVSIVIAVHNYAAYTFCCLASIAMNRPQADVEVVVIDDASVDGTSTMLASITGIRFIRNERNLGYLRSANRGAKIARGQYIHLLNNDTQVQKGWLDALLAALESDAETVIAGSKLIYPSGHLQEAGAALKRDGRVELIGLNDNPESSTYDRRRRVDHCSGASILIDKAFFEQVQGFDEIYAPAYYEDCELSLRAIDLGRSVVYEPRSSVIHHLSVSTKEDRSEKGRLIRANRGMFVDRWRDTLASLDSVRLIAFYLPQFHPIPENDLWWGKGFTEWTNVTRAAPNFSGHEQPQLPADLGFYDLRVPEAREEQAHLAREYGVSGFCYYYYWFNGKRLLQRPLDEVVESGKPDFPFCICWANENWSRRWDGRESEVLIAQNHTHSDDLAFIRQLRPLLEDRRYIKIRGRALVLVYRTDLLPDAARTAAIWRDYCRREGLGELFLACVHSFGTVLDPTMVGFDGAVEFPPHERAVVLERQPRMSNRRFKGCVFDYVATSRNFLARPLPEYPFFRTVMPRWDNTARRQDAGDIFVRSTPDAYERWLAEIVEQTRRFSAPGERLVFINAWNEWAEGNYLEPDQRHGHGYLQATRRALGSPQPIGVGNARAGTRAVQESGRPRKS